MYKKALFATVMFLIILPRVCLPQFAVIDASNVAQSTITAVNSVRQTAGQLIQIQQEAQFIVHQLEQLAYDAANLTKNPLNLYNDLMGTIGTYNRVLLDAQGVGYQLQNVGGAFDRLYPGAGLPVGQLGAQASQWVAQIRATTRTAMQTQAVVDRLAWQQQFVGQSLAASDAAAGNLAAIQATNQMLGVMADQYASTQQLLAAGQRQYAAALAAEAASAEAARQASDNWMRDYGQMAPVKGVGIPAFQ